VQRQSITDLARHFQADVVDISHDAVIIELAAKPPRIDAFIQLMKPFGIIEVARSGAMAMPRSVMEDGCLETDEEDLNESLSDGKVDVTQLPPG
jgi:acetolactate synthase-1/3 small subunit